MAITHNAKTTMTARTISVDVPIGEILRRRAAAVRSLTAERPSFASLDRAIHRRR
jgi:hypothetical protein